MKFGIFFLAATCWAQTPDLFAIDPNLKPEWQKRGEERRGSVLIEDVSFRAQSGGRIEAYLVKPPGSGRGPGALFVHWYESEAANSNRTQFLDEAVELARHGVFSMLVSTPWSDPQWYVKRDVKRDFENSVAEAKDLRWALELLARQDRVDRARLALVGHDFGAMYGILAASNGPPLAAAAFQAFTTSFADWFLYNQRTLSAEGQQAVRDRLKPLDPLRYLPALGKTPVLLQFAMDDFYVPRPKADALEAAVQGPKRIQWYQASHGLNAQASADRIAWLQSELGVK